MVMGVKVVPGSKKEKIEVGPNGSLIARITARPIEGEANKMLTKKLAKLLGIASSNCTVIKGVKSKEKVVELVFYYTKSKPVEYFCNKIQNLV